MQCDIENICYSYNQTFTNKPNFGIKYPTWSWYIIKQINQTKPKIKIFSVFWAIRIEKKYSLIQVIIIIRRLQKSFKKL